MLLEPDGAASSVVVSGANGAWADAHVAAVCDPVSYTHLTLPTKA